MSQRRSEVLHLAAVTESASCVGVVTQRCGLFTRHQYVLCLVSEQLLPDQPNARAQ